MSGSKKFPNFQATQTMFSSLKFNSLAIVGYQWIRLLSSVQGNMKLPRLEALRQQLKVEDDDMLAQAMVESSPKPKKNKVKLPKWLKMVCQIYFIVDLSCFLEDPGWRNVPFSPIFFAFFEAFDCV